MKICKVKDCERQAVNKRKAGYCYAHRARALRKQNIYAEIVDRRYLNGNECGKCRKGMVIHHVDESYCLSCNRYETKEEYVVDGEPWFGYILLDTCVESTPSAKVSV